MTGKGMAEVIKDQVTSTEEVALDLKKTKAIEAVV
jgi:hypothetical protein